MAWLSCALVVGGCGGSLNSSDAATAVVTGGTANAEDAHVHGDGGQLSMGTEAALSDAAATDAAVIRDAAMTDAFVSGTGGTGGPLDSGGTGGCGTNLDLGSGAWVEEAQLTCDGGEREPQQKLWELLFNAGSLNVTWTPFETYVDYWGSYQVTPGLLPGTGTLHLQVDGGNYVPVDIDPDGHYTICNDTLVLEDMWLGTYMSAIVPPGCGHRFRR